MKKHIEELLVAEFPEISESKVKFLSGQFLRMSACEVPVTYDPRLDHVRNVICQELIVNIGAFHANTRIDNVKYSRHIFCYMVTKVLYPEQYSQETIGRYIGGIDHFRHCTVSNSVKVCSAMIKTSKDFREIIAEITDKLVNKQYSI